MILHLRLGVETFLLRRWRCRLHFDRWGLKSEWFWLGEGLAFGCVLGGFPHFSVVDRISFDLRWELPRDGCFEPWGVWRRLRLQLCQVKILASVIAYVHGLMEPPFGVETVKDDGVDRDCDNLHNDLDEGADQ